MIKCLWFRGGESLLKFLIPIDDVLCRDEPQHRTKHATQHFRYDASSGDLSDISIVHRYRYLDLPHYLPHMRAVTPFNSCQILVFEVHQHLPRFSQQASRIKTTHGFLHARILSRGLQWRIHWNQTHVQRGTRWVFKSLWGMLVEWILSSRAILHTITRTWRNFSMQCP